VVADSNRYASIIWNGVGVLHRDLDVGEPFLLEEPTSTRRVDEAAAFGPPCFSMTACAATPVAPTRIGTCRLAPRARLL